MPSRHYHSRFVRDFKVWTLESIDYCHYTVPLNVANHNGFVFPGEYVGQYGVYEAVQHVYEKNESLNHLLHDDYLLTNTRYFATDMEKGIEKIRDEFRSQNRIDPNAHVIFIAPGNEKAEAQFCIENLRKGVKEFLLKYSAPSSLSPKALPLEGNFVTVMSLHSGSEGEAFVKQYLSEHEWTGRLIMTSEQNNQHYDAMAASDFGFVYDGQMVSAANALHLPVNCIINMRMQHQWWHDFYNRWWNDMNLVADNHINPELIGGEAWWGKICDTLAESYVRPEHRYETIQMCDGFVQDAMSYKPIDRSVVRTKDLLLDGQAYDQHYEPFQLAARHMWKDIKAYDTGVGQLTGTASEGLRVQIPNL